MDKSKTKSRKRKHSQGNDDKLHTKIQKSENGSVNEVDIGPVATFDGVNNAAVKEPYINENMNNQNPFSQENPEELTAQFTTKFDMKGFRRKLRGDKFIVELRHFLYLHDAGKRNIVEKFLENKGTALEIVEAFRKIDTSNLVQTHYLSKALRIVLDRIAANDPSEWEDAMRACRFLLKLDPKILSRLLSSKNPEHQSNCIELMTLFAIVVPAEIRPLLNIFSAVHSAERTILSFKYDTESEGAVQVAYIRFIVSILVSGNISSIRHLLEKNELISLCLQDLWRIDHEIVIALLTAIKEGIVENLLVTKTQKVRIFDVKHCLLLLKLYDWHGPAYVKAQKTLKNRTLTDVVDEGKKELVRQSLNELLIPLLTSRKFGIAYDAMRYYKQRKNEIQRQILKEIKMPWLDPLKKDLIIKILQACPELAEGMVHHLSENAKKESFATGLAPIFLFIADIVEQLSPETMRVGFQYITLSHIMHWIKKLCLPERVLRALGSKKFLHSGEATHRVLGVKILLVLFNQYCNYMTAIIEREKFKGNELKKFRFEILDHIFVNFPTVEKILLSLFMSIETEDEYLMQHMRYTFDLLLNICKVNRSFIDRTATVIDYIKLLGILFKSEHNEEFLPVKLKGMELLLVLNPSSLQPTDDEFRVALQNLCLILMNDTNDNFDVAPVLQKLLSNSKVFENGPLEIDIWIEAMKLVDEKSRTSVAKCWHLLRKATYVDTSMPNNTDYMSKTNLSALFRDIENGTSIEGYMDIPMMSKALVLMLKHLHIFPKSSMYFEYVAFLLFHFIPAPRAIYEIYSSNFTTFYKYMMQWIDKQKPGKLKCKNLVGFDALHLALFEGRMEFAEIFKGDKKFVIGETELLLHPNLYRDRYVMLLIYQVCFIVSQLAENMNLEVQQANAASYYLINFLELLNSSAVRQQDTSVKFDTSPTEIIRDLHIELALKYIYSRHLLLLQNFNIFGSEQSERNYVKFMCSVTDAVKEFKIENFESFTVNFRAKMVNQITASINETLQSGTLPSSDLVVTSLESFQLSDENCLQILDHLMRLEVKHLVQTESNRSNYFNILVYVLNRLAILRKVIDKQDIILKVLDFYAQLITAMKTEMSLEKLEEALYGVLTISHQCMPKIPATVFHAIFESNKISKSTVNFACMILERRPDLISEFLSIVPSHLSKKELIYPLLNVVITMQGEFNSEVADAVYKECKNGIMKAIEKPQKAAMIYKENVEASIFLINKSMVTSEFYKKSIKTDSVEIFQLEMVEAIFIKEIKAHSEDTGTQKLIFESFINNLLHFLTVVTKREPLDFKKVAMAMHFMDAWIKQYKPSDKGNNFESIIESPAWQGFCKTCLKLGMRAVEENGQQIAGCDENVNSLFLKLLAYLFDNFYEKNTDHPHAALFFEMITSHSRFFDIVLAQSQSLVKSHLMHLMLVLAQTNHFVMDEKHIPILLGAYQARLSFCDRYILALMQLYEQCGVDFSKYRPFLWGEAAIDQYSLRSQDESPVLRQDQSVSQLMKMFDAYTSNLTMRNFPVWRNLDTIKQLPEIEFDDPRNDCKYNLSNDIKEKIENGDFDSDSASVKLYPVKQNIYDECYDPAFVIPVLTMSLAPGSYIYPVLPVQNGLLGIAFAALSSLDKDMRMAAGLVHLRYRDQFMNSKFLDKPLWIQAYDTIQTGLEDLQEHWKKHKKASIPRVPFGPGLFIATTMTILINPLDSMYKSLSMILRAKENLNFLQIPEFNALFQNSDVDHLTRRQFIIDIIKDGIKCSSDLFLIVTTGVLKALMGFYEPTVSPIDINLRILSVLNVCVKIPQSIRLMIDNVGIISWINGVINSCEFYQFDILEGIISIIKNIWYSVKATEKIPSRLSSIEQRIFLLNVKLIPLLSNRLSLTCFTNFLNVLAKTASGNHRLVTDKSLDHIIWCVQRHFSDHLWYIENVRKFGVDSIETSDAYSKNLKRSNVDENCASGLLNLRDFVVRWKELE